MFFTAVSGLFAGAGDFLTRIFLLAADQAKDAWLRFSTDDLPERDRLVIWREAIARSIARIDVEPLSDRFLSEGRALRVGDLTVANLAITAVRSERSRALVTDGNDDVLLIMLTEGKGLVRQLNREAIVEPGNAVLVSNADPSTFTVPQDARGYSLRMPRRAFLPLAARLEDAFLKPIPSTNVAVCLLRAYIGALEQNMKPLTLAQRHVIATNIYDLVGLTVGMPRENAEVATGRGLRAARLAAIKADIAANIGVQNLSAAWIAARHGVTASYVRRLFAENDATFVQFVLEYRLALAHRQLSDPRLGDQAIGTVAYAVGFGDLSYFNRRFRRRYGGSPSDIRAAARDSD